MDTTAEVKVLFQEGYGLESTFASDTHKLARMLAAYYGIDAANIGMVETAITETNESFEVQVKNITNVDIHQESQKHFDRQKQKRSGRIYQDLEYQGDLCGGLWHGRTIMCLIAIKIGCSHKRILMM